MRTDHCGTLRASDIGREVAVCGWVGRRREHGEHLAFIDLRDHTGLVQCVVDGAADLRSEYVVRITGTVRQRPDGTTNDNMPTGEIEIGDCSVEILNVAEPPPFQLNDRVEVDEMVRLAHRYVDLRTERMQRNLRIRAKVNASLRRAMDDQGFVEIETPMLIASTPEGARDFVVPSRLSPGSFYALPQSPQLFKQLCMVGGIDRYYQIARCLRDEDLRADRQFEFMQLDAEASFVSQEEVLAFISVAVSAAVEEVTGQKMGDVPRMTWQEAQERFGSDKPDIRFGMELLELTPNFAATEFNAFKADCVKGIVVDGGAEFTRSKLDELTDKAKRWGAKGLVWMRVKDGGELDSPVAKFLSADELAGLVATTGAKTGDLLLLVADDRPKVCHVLGLLRLELGRPPVTEGGLQFLWVVDFPLFESLDDAGNPVPAHHPFTMPHAEDVALLDTGNPQDLLKVRSQAYDLVLNGWELGSGSVRIHRGDIQSRMFELLGIGAEEQQSKFGFLLDAFRFGAPPHAGFAFGIDRLVALLAGEENIREVIAFPKTQSGTDPLTHAPTPIDTAQLDELGLRLLPTKKTD
ncbi:MAG: aspartate--tRNA ligase [Actinobacteria bacterium]|nr:aspartate--tRNA ligase [Actinomycetota bacterium]MSZ94032.1 aspartate--tRNA ligase [Actinomycetota bacterium]